jgi:lysophospholipase L1-like esterase
MVYVISPTWRGDKTEGTATIPTMEDIVRLEKEVADTFCLPFYDLYHRSGINSLTASVYLTNDLLHPSDAGDSLLANKCAKFIQSN